MQGDCEGAQPLIETRRSKERVTMRIASKKGYTNTKTESMAHPPTPTTPAPALAIFPFIPTQRRYPDDKGV